MLAFTNLRVVDIETWGEHEGNNGGIRIHWSTDDIGFGTIDIVKDKDNSLRISSECMGQAFVEKVLETLVRQAKITD
jgi:hypothetical protein